MHLAAVDGLLHGAGGDEAVHVHIAALPDGECPVHRLCRQRIGNPKA